MSRRPRAVDFEAEEAPPEADALDGFPHPRMTQVLFGQAMAERELANALATGRIHHAWLLTGREGIGKATLAYRFAGAALASDAERAALTPGRLDVPASAIVARQVRALSHPGLAVVRRPWNRETKRFSQVIPVDEVRRLKGFLQHSASERGHRVVIIDRAEEMNIAAANALLKSLEEPPPRTVFLLVCSEPGRLLPTIHSRCRRLAMRTLAKPDMLEAVGSALAAAGHDGPAPEQSELIGTLAEGSVRRALELLEGGAIALHGKLVDLLSTLPRLDFEAAHRLAETAGGYGADREFQSFHALLSDLVARLLRTRTVGEEATAPERALAARLFPEGTDVAKLATWAALWETMAREKADALALNLDRKALILDTFRRIEAASRA